MANPEIVANELEKGNTIQKSLLAGGYSEHQARRGVAGLSKAVYKALRKNGKAMLKVNKAFTLQEKAEIAMARLTLNCLEGKDAGVMSAKQIGSHKDLALWQTEVQTGVIVLQMPESIVQKTQKALEEETKP